MDTLKLFTIEEIRNLLVKWWGLYRTVDMDLQANDKFMILLYKKTFEVMSIATLIGENSIDSFAEAIENDKADELLANLRYSIVSKYPKEDDFIKAMSDTVLRLYSLPFDSKPLFKGSAR